MVKVFVIRGGKVVAEYVLTKPVISAGRKPDNDIWLNDTVISRRHLEILIGDSVQVHDLNSRNGTQLNGKSITQAVAKNGDLLMVGPFHLKFAIEESVEEDLGGQGAEQSDADATQALHFWDADGSKSTPLGMAKILEGDGTGDVLDLRNPFTAVGKMGEQVAVITRRSSGYSIRAVSGGRQSLKVNGEEVESDVRDLKDEDLIEISGMKLKFILLNAG